MRVGVGKNRHFNEWQKDHMREMRNRGESYEQIGSKFDCSGTTVKYWLDKDYREQQIGRFRKQYEEKQQKPKIEGLSNKEIRENINQTAHRIKLDNEMREAYLEKLIINKIIDRFIEVLDKINETSEKLGLREIIKTTVEHSLHPKEDRLYKLIHKIGEREFGKIMNAQEEQTS